MRVVAGSSRGLRIEAPPGSSTRPTSDRVRESMFNALASIDAIDGTRVLDLFAGSGALAIEALSRGADTATLVESDRAARTTIEANLTRARVADRASLVAGDARAFLARAPVPFDLVLLDPPYRFDGWPGLLDALLPRLADDAVVVIEADQSVTVPPPLAVVREKSYGSTVVTFARMPSSPHFSNPALPAGDHE